MTVTVCPLVLELNRVRRGDLDTTIPPSPEGSGWLLNRCGAALGRQSLAAPLPAVGGFRSQSGRGSGGNHRRGGHHVQAGGLERDTVARLAVLLRDPGQGLQVTRDDLVTVLGGRLVGADDRDVQLPVPLH